MKVETKNYINELRHTVTQAYLNYEIWWVYKSKDTRPLYIDSMNRYPLFFQTSIHAHFVALLIELYRLYETRSDTFNIPSLLKLLRDENSIAINELEALEAIYKIEAKPLWIKVNILRNKLFAHRSTGFTTEEIFKQAGISSDNLRDLMKITKNFLKKLSHTCNSSSHAFNLSSRENTLNLLKDLNSINKG